MAVSGISACVAVEPEAGVGAGREAPPQRTVAPRIVQQPAREALEAATPLARTPPPERPAAPEAVPPPGRRAAAQRSEPTSAPPAPAPPAALPGTGVELCALGERYGGWKPGSKESRLCQETYGD